MENLYFGCFEAPLADTLRSDHVPVGAGEAGTKRQEKEMQLETGPLGRRRDREREESALAAERPWGGCRCQLALVPTDFLLLKVREPPP